MKIIPAKKLRDVGGRGSAVLLELRTRHSEDDPGYEREAGLVLVRALKSKHTTVL